MKYGRNQINKAGDILISSSNEEEVNRAIEIINDWRTLHLPALDELQNEIVSMFEKEGIQIHIVSRRLKRLSSIQKKLDRNEGMKLGGLQDIGGLRIVVPSMSVLDKALLILEKNIPKHFELTKAPMNYVLEPKDSGYRSIHLIYKYQSENSDIDGMRVELQLRTKLQHSWAMAVETAELVTKTALKASQGATEWLTFFKIISSIFAINEGTCILSEHKEKNYTRNNLKQQLLLLNKENHFVDTLKALNVSNIQSKKEDHKNGYYILNIDFVNKTVAIRAFPKDNEQEASELYSETEKKIDNGKNAVVLVSVPQMQELQEAYPSFFLDTNNFIKTIESEMEKNSTVLDEITFPEYITEFHPESNEQCAKYEKEYFDLVKKNTKKMEEQ